MIEFLDVYDANRRIIGTADRNVVHTFGLWHKTVHCWIVINGNIVFQRRAKTKDNGGKLYTTASGHVFAGETIEQAFVREVSQEIGLSITNPKKLYEGVWIGDFKKSDGSMFVDRVFCNVFFANYDGKLQDFKFNDGEVESIVSIDLKDFINFSHNPIDSIKSKEFNGQTISEISITAKDFVLIGDETVYDKFGKIAEQINFQGK